MRIKKKKNPNSLIAELKDPELLPHWSKPNPHKSSWNDMMLYVREMVIERFFFLRGEGIYK